ncbi:CdaR family transcriptional regulator [Oceanobacillus kimchii]|uniref:CdaR family transcriptional regulator n=1 Tax=Oceanobacillus kimchii TaxID=746691 RepID=UPI000984140C|nr:sugar diacid recognition domain-containing protein [Oceanobacillus kimchii]
MNIYHIADKIINVIKDMIDEQIIICDTKGIIIASTNQERVGDYHEGSVLVIKNKEPLMITDSLTINLKGVKTGINLPLFFNKSVIGVIGITGEIEKIKPFGEIVRKMTELLIHENNYYEQIEFEHRSVENVIFDLLRSKKVDRPLLDRAETLGMTLDGTKQVIILVINKINSTLQNQVWQYLNNLIPEKDILVRWGNNRLFWMHTLSSKKIKPDFLKTLQKACENNFPIELHIGVGDTAIIGDLYRSYEEALIAINYFPVNTRISFHTDLQLELCLQDISDDTKKEYIHRTIGTLIDHKQLLHTLHVFIENESSLQKTAEALFIHINTLHYRLSKIHQFTGLDPKRFKDLTNLYLAITFLDEHTINSNNTSSFSYKNT